MFSHAVDGPGRYLGRLHLRPAKSLRPKRRMTPIQCDSVLHRCKCRGLGRPGESRRGAAVRVGGGQGEVVRRSTSFTVLPRTKTSPLGFFFVCPSSSLLLSTSSTTSPRHHLPSRQTVLLGSVGSGLAFTPKASAVFSPVEALVDPPCLLPKCERQQFSAPSPRRIMEKNPGQAFRHAAVGCCHAMWGPHFA